MLLRICVVLKSQRLPRRGGYYPPAVSIVIIFAKFKIVFDTGGYYPAPTVIFDNSVYFTDAQCAPLH